MTKMFRIVIAGTAIVWALLIACSVIREWIRYTIVFVRKLKSPEKNPFSAVIKDTSFPSPKTGHQKAAL